MAAPYDPNKYDPNMIITAADHKLAANDLEGGQMVFQSALLDWVDDAREGSTDGNSEQLREAVATLWVAYAHFLAKAKQFKSATEAYEQALSCPVAGAVGRVYLDFARFCTDRGKIRTAQDVYMRALVGKSGVPAAVTDEQDQTLLWSEFLEMMKQTTPDLTLNDLKTAVEAEAAAAAGSLAEAVQSGTTVDDATTQSPPAKRIKLEDGTTAAATNTTSAQLPPQAYSPTPAESKTHVVTTESVQDEALIFAALIQDQTLPPEIRGVWILRDGNTPPQAPHPLFGPELPKLSDPTGKDLLGGDLALAVIERLLGPSGSVLLDICSALWTLTALKEKESQAELSSFDETMKKKWTDLEATLENRMSVVEAASMAVEQLNRSERQAFQQRCGHQRVHILSQIAWGFRQLLCVQQQVLTKLDVPGFVGPTIDASALEIQSRVCSFLHSAFYLRKRIGEVPHVKMFKTQAERLRRDHVPGVPSFNSNSNNNPMPQGQYNMPLPPLPQGHYQPPPPPPQMQQQGYGYPGQQGHMMPPQQQQPQHGYGGPPPQGQYPPYYHQ